MASGRRQLGAIFECKFERKNAFEIAGGERSRCWLLYPCREPWGILPGSCGVLSKASGKLLKGLPDLECAWRNTQSLVADALIICLFTACGDFTSCFVATWMCHPFLFRQAPHLTSRGSKFLQLQYCGRAVGFNSSLVYCRNGMSVERFSWRQPQVYLSLCDARRVSVWSFRVTLSLRYRVRKLGTSSFWSTIANASLWSFVWIDCGVEQSIEIPVSPLILRYIFWIW